MTTDVLTLRLLNGEERPVHVRSWIGAFAIHRPISSPKNRWQITHVLTTYCVAKARKLEDAQRVALALSLLGGWNFTSSKVPSPLRENAKALLLTFADVTLD